MRLCLVEDNAAAGLEPLTLTRPVYDLLLGSSSLGSKIARALKIGPGPLRRGAVIRHYLAAVQQARDPRTAVNDRDWLARGPVIVVNARWVPPSGLEVPSGSGAWLGLCDGQPAFAVVGPEQAVRLEPNAIDSWFEEVAATCGGKEVGGEWIHHPWDLVARNADHVIRDFQVEGKVGLNNKHLTTAALVGPASQLFIHETARIDPYTVFDTTNGPITVAAGAWVQPFTRIEGPSYVGRDTHLFRANLRGGVTIGPTCRIGGEVEASVVYGYSNKYHEGFLGHAYVGAVGQPRRDHVEQRPAQRLWRGARPARRRPGGDRPGEGRLLHRRPHPHRPGEHAQHGHGAGRDVQRAAGRTALAQARPVIRGGPPRPRRARTSRSSSCSRPPGSSWDAAARSSARSRSSSTGTSTSRPVWSVSGPSRRATTAAPTTGRSLPSGFERVITARRAGQLACTPRPCPDRESGHPVDARRPSVALTAAVRTGSDGCATSRLGAARQARPGAAGQGEARPGGARLGMARPARPAAVAGGGLPVVHREPLLGRDAHPREPSLPPPTLRQDPPSCVIRPFPRRPRSCTTLRGDDDAIAALATS